MAGPADDLRRRLASLRDAFLRDLPVRVARIGELWPEEKPDWECQRATELRLVAHGLKGSAGTFGYQELSDHAARLERLLAQSLAGDGPPGAEQCLAIYEAASTLRAAAAQVLRRSTRDFEGRAPSRALTTLYVLGEEHVHSGRLLAELRAYGFRPSPVPDRDSLTAAVAELEPDAIVIDAATARSPGPLIAVVEMLNAGRNPRIPSIVVASTGDAAERLAAVRAGIDGYLEAPVETSALVRALDSLSAASESAAYRVLVAAADRAAADGFCMTLDAAGMHTRQVGEPLLILDAVADFEPDLVLLDSFLGPCTGRELAAVLRQALGSSGLPIVLFAAVDQPPPGFDIEVLRRPVPDDCLIAVVAAHAERSRTLRSLAIEERETRLLTRAAFGGRLQLELSHARAVGRQLTLALIDLDGLEALNAAQGPAAGDAVLGRLALMLRRRLNRQDAVGRLEGGRFAVLMADTRVDAAAELLDRLRAAFAALEHDGGEAAPRFRASISCGAVDGARHSTAAAALAAAEASLLAAKAGGRNRTVIGGLPAA